MLRIYRLIAILALLIIIGLTSGCYTMVGYPPEVEEGVIEKETLEGEVYRYDRYSRPYSYYWDYYDSYYGLWYPYSYYYYRDYPRRWYYDDHYNWYYDDNYYAPEKKPETRQRGTSELRRTPRPEIRRESSQEEEERKQSNEKTPDRQRSVERTQRSVKKQEDSSNDTEKRQIKRKSRDED